MGTMLDRTEPMEESILEKLSRRPDWMKLSVEQRIQFLKDSITKVEQRKASLETELTRLEHLQALQAKRRQ